MFMSNYNPLTNNINNLDDRLTFDVYIARNFGRSLRIPDTSLQTSVNFPRTRPLTCMEQSAFLFSINQESTENKKAVKNKVKDIFLYALFMKQKKIQGLSVGSMALKQHVHRPM